MIRLTRETLDLSSLLGAQDRDGAVCLFVGVVRDHNAGRRVRYLEYEAYEEMALAQLAEIEDEVRRRWPVSEVRLEHRLGRLEIGEASVAVAVSSPHRAEAFAACRHVIERLKEDAPIWKREHGDDGVTWVGLGP